jgi:lysozyme family protein
MANPRLYIPKVLQWEGGFVNDPLDRGGATNKGVTIACFKSMGFDNDGDGDIDIDDLRRLSDDQAFAIMKKLYWNRWHADEIENQSIAEILVDFVWGSGKWGIVVPQGALGLVADGVVGPKTLAVVNGRNQEEIFNTIKASRLIFIENIIKNNPSQVRFERGWKNRINSFKFKENYV